MLHVRVVLGTTALWLIVCCLARAICTCAGAQTSFAVSTMLMPHLPHHSFAKLRVWEVHVH